MTRETKIGLLVGLAFIIVIGILLSDHLSINNESTQASLTQVGANVRQGAAVPNAAVAIPVPSQVPVAPQLPLPTSQELAPRPETTSIVRITPPEQSPIVVRQAPQVNPQVTEAAELSNYASVTPAPEPTAPIVTMLPTPAPTAEPAVMLAESTGVPVELTQLAMQNGEQLVPISTNPEPAPTRLAVTQTRRYTVASGDTLSKIALKFYGVDSRANRERIINANPALKANPNLLVIGQSYNVPELENSPVVPPAAETRAEPAPVKSSDKVYVVQANDSLWKIAARQLGDGNQWKKIAELNRDVLDGGENVRAGMKLKMPQ